MVLIFKSKKALDFLLKHGEVITFRLHERKAGKDWITDRRGGKKIADVEVVLLEETKTPHDFNKFQQYVDKSGFDSIEEWLSEIIKLNPACKLRDAETGYFYLVKLLHRVIQ